MRRNCLILQKKFSTRWRHLYISKSQGMSAARLALGGITARAPRSFTSARIALVSKALSASRAAKARCFRSGATPTLSCRCPGSRTKRRRLPSASTRATRPGRRFRSSGRGANDRWPEPPLCAGAVLVPPDDGSIDDHGLEIGIFRQVLEDPVEHAAFGPAAKSVEDRVPVPEARAKVAPRRSDTHDPQNRLQEKPVVRCRTAGISGFSRKKRCDPLPLIITQHHPIQGQLPFASLEANFTERGNPSTIPSFFM